MFFKACQKFSTFRFSDTSWMSVCNFFFLKLVICSHSLLLDYFLFKKDVSVKVWRNYFGSIGSHICRWGKNML